MLQLAADSNEYELVEIYVEHLIDVPVNVKVWAKEKGKNFVIREDVEVV